MPALLGVLFGLWVVIGACTSKPDYLKYPHEVSVGDCVTEGYGRYVGFVVAKGEYGVWVDFGNGRTAYETGVLSMADCPRRHE